jgi:hypothetical protein
MSDPSDPLAEDVRAELDYMETVTEELEALAEDVGAAPTPSRT